MKITSNSKGSTKERIPAIAYTSEQPSIRSLQRYRGGSTVLGVLILAMILLVGCTDIFGPSDTELADSPRSIPVATEPKITLDPSSGTVGTFVTVTGLGWKPSAMIEVRLADREGQSNVLAADNTNESGAFSTGFLYPIGDRWNQPGSYLVAVSLQGDDVVVASSFVFESPGSAADEDGTSPSLFMAPTATLMAPPTPGMAVPTREAAIELASPTSRPLPTQPAEPSDSGSLTNKDDYIDIAERGKSVTMTCNSGDSIYVTENNHTVVLLGHCGEIVVRGNSNTIYYEAADTITNTGNNNSIQQG